MSTLVRGTSAIAARTSARAAVQLVGGGRVIVKVALGEPDAADVDGTAGDPA